MEGELLKKIFYGIIGTLQFQGSFPCLEDGLTLGHEFSGIVERVGAGVTQFEAGDRVVADPNK